MSLHPANEAQRARLLSAEHWLCVERARLYTESYRRTEGVHPSLRAAMAFRNVFLGMSVRLEPDELLVGNRSSKLIAPPLALERGDFSFIFQHLFGPLQAFGYRIEPEARAQLFDELLPYWEGKTVRAAKLDALERHQLTSPLSLSPASFVKRVRAFGWESLKKLLPKGLTVPGLVRAMRAGRGRQREGPRPLHRHPGAHRARPRARARARVRGLA